MMTALYPMIFKRKSFHLVRETQTISPDVLQSIKDMYSSFQPLIPEIKTDIRIVPAEQTTCKRGQEYCILLYSEKKENFLQNIGYIGEQLDLNLASLGIGALWFGIGKPDAPIHRGLDFVIMIAIAKVAEDKFRRDMFKSKRKPLDEIWHGECYWEIGNIVRFAPSACNTQPWLVNAGENKLTISRYQKPGKRGIMPANQVTHYNRINVGIFLFFLELCMSETGLQFQREVFTDNSENISKYVVNAVYRIS